jgi:hypothetical protein
MNSFNDLNNYAATLIDYTDSRPSGATFDRAEITYFNEITFTSTAYAAIPSGINIEEVRNYSTANLSIVFTIESRAVDPLTGATLTWPSTPTGVTIAQSGNIYTITGVKTKAQWDVIKKPTWNVPAGYASKFGWYVNVDINYFDSSLGFKTYTYIVYDERYYYDIRMLSNFNVAVSARRFLGITKTLSAVSTLYARPRVEPFGTPSTFNYTSGTTQTITGVPAYTDGNASATWTVTITPSRTLPISTITSTGSGGTFTFNNSTKVTTIVGTPSQVSSRLQGLTLTSVANQDYDFDLAYTAINEFSETDSATQRLTSVNYTYLSSVGDDTFTTGALESILAPTITDSAYTGIGSYTLDVYTDTGSNLTTIASDQSAVNLSFQTGTTFSGSNARFMQVNKNENRMTTRNPFFGGSSSRGSVKIYSASGLGWTEDTEFGGSVGDVMGPNAISANGSRIAIASPGNASNKGLVTVYDKSGSTWSATTGLTTTTLGTTSQIGTSVSTSEDGLVIAAGAPFYSPSTFTNSGGVIVWRWTGSSWAETSIVNPSSRIDELFGYSVRLSANGLYLSVMGTSDVAGSQKCYVYFWNGSSWGLQKSFTDGTPVRRSLSTFNSDATSIVEYFDTVGSAGNVSARYWKRTGTSWSNVDTITYYKTSNEHLPQLSYDGRHLLLTEEGGGDFDIKIYKLYTNTFYYQTTISVPYWPFPGRTDGWTATNRVYMIDSITDVNATTQTWVYKFYSLGTTAVNYTTSPTGMAWNNGTKTYTFTGEKAEINAVVGSMKVTAAATTNFQLIYKLTTPTSVIVYRSQRLTKN